MPKIVDEDENGIFVQPDDGGPPIRMAKTPGIVEALGAVQPQPNAQETPQAGAPPVQHPWENWTEEQKAQMRKDIQTVDLAKHQFTAGQRFPIKGGAEALARVAGQGGLTPDEATTLSRFKVFEETTGGDPNWQGPLQINTGPAEPLLTKEEEAARNAAFFAADKEGKGKLWSKEADQAVRSRADHLYDPLVFPQAALGKALAANDSKKKRG